MKDIIIDEQLRDKFLDSIDKTETCWLWKGRKDRDGYGKVSIKKREYRSNRVAYVLFYGIQPGENHVLHTCDNPSCVRPDHLWLGTNKQNMEDRTRKLRTGNLKISWDIVREMRRIWCTTDLSVTEIDDIFNYSSCGCILRNIIWHDPNYKPPDKIPGRKKGP